MPGKTRYVLNLLLTVICLSFFTLSCTRQAPDIAYHSQILYRDDEVVYDAVGELRGSHKTYIYDLDTNRAWLVTADASLMPRGWSPSGKQILFDGITEARAGQVWLSNSDGSKMEKVFDVKDYPEIAQRFTFDPERNSTHESFWLNDTIIVINSILFNIETRQILDIRDGQIIEIAPGGEYWIERRDGLKLFLRFLSGEEFALPWQGYNISPDGTTIAYVGVIDNTPTVFIARVDREHGVYDEKVLTSLPEISTIAWSPDGLHFLYVLRNADENGWPFVGMCVVISALNGETVRNYPDCDYGGGNIWWSPHLDGFIATTYQQQYFFYDTETGSKKSIDALSANLPSGNGRFFVDWRLIPVP